MSDRPSPAGDTSVLPVGDAAVPSAQARSPFAFLLEASAKDMVRSTSPTVLAPNLNTTDIAHLAGALDEARGAVGKTTPNPPVGAVVVAANGDVVGRGFTAPVGGPHAEVAALAQAGSRANGGTVYVSLEPCAHTGRTPPCTSALIQAGVARVVLATYDPNPRVDGRGESTLRAAGIDVTVADDGELAARARALIVPFAQTLQRQRPWTIVKVATSLDGKVATNSGDSRWVTGATARRVVHALRHHVDGVVVGSRTVAKDAPALTVREMLSGAAPSRHPRRIVIDGALKTAVDAEVFKSHAIDSATPLVAHAFDAPADRAAAFDNAQIERRCLGDVRTDLPALWQSLATDGMTSVLVEAGPSLFRALLEAKLVDEVWWFSAPKVVGGDGVSAVGPLGAVKMDRVLAIAPRRYLCAADILTIGTLASP